MTIGDMQPKFGGRPLIPPPPAAAKEVIVGTESHPFAGRGYPGARCAGRLGSIEGSLCGEPRSESIHEDHGNWCIVCDGRIRVMSFRGTGVCSEIHRKQRDGEPLTQYKAVAP